MTRLTVVKDAVDENRQARLLGGPSCSHQTGDGAWTGLAALRLITRPTAWRCTCLVFLNRYQRARLEKLSGYSQIPNSTILEMDQNGRLFLIVQHCDYYKNDLNLKLIRRVLCEHLCFTCVRQSQYLLDTLNIPTRNFLFSQTSVYAQEQCQMYN